MYGDLVRLLVPGFLSSTFRVGGHSYGLRSLNPGDLANLAAIVPVGDPTWRLWVVAASVWVADGAFFLEDSSLAPRAVYECLLRSSPTVVGQMFGTCVGFFRRMREANHYLESYLYEDESRRLWEGTRRGHYPLWSRASVPGLSRLGFNPFQASWMAWNQLEDQRLDQEYQWSLAKVMVSLQSHKSYQKLEDRDKARAESQRAARAAAQERAYAQYQGLLDEEGQPRDGNALRNPTRTPQELAEEMRRWVAGDLDWHDQVVADYKENLRRQQEEIEQETRELQRMAAEKRREQETLLGTARPQLVAYTPQQLEQKLAGSPRVRQIYEEGPVTHTFNRYLRQEPSPGYLTLDSAGRVALTESTPSAATSLSLDDLVASRTLRLDDD